MMKQSAIFISTALFCLMAAFHADACTGISLPAKDGSRVVARTVEWNESHIQYGYVVSPRGHQHQSFTPTGLNGLKYASIYGYVGIYAGYEPFIVEGVNETGLSAGLFRFPQCGEYVSYDSARNDRTLCDMQFVSWVLSQFSTIEQMKDMLPGLDLVTLNHMAGPVHWRIAEPGGRTVVLEVLNGTTRFYEDMLGVLTDSSACLLPAADLGNYLSPHAAQIDFAGYFTPASRCERAVFFQGAVPVAVNGFDAVLQAFHILNNFDIPAGMQCFTEDGTAEVTGATQITSATDLKSMKFYYRTALNSNIRCINLMDIDFHKVRYQSHPLDRTQVQPVEKVKVR